MQLTRETQPASDIERTKAARAALDDTAALLKLHRLVHSVAALAPPTAHIISARQPLLSRRRIGLFSGSFNPLTLAHLAVADSARQVAALDTVVWTISAVTVDKERVQRASVPDRLAQMDAFVRITSADALALVNRGLYVEEAAALRGRLAREADLYILVGFDKIVQIFDPRYYTDRDAALRELFALAHILVAPREGFGADALAELLARPENRQYAEFVRFVPVPPEHTHDSSTEARRLAAAFPLRPRALRQLVPPEGLALALTGAYRSPGEDAAIEAIDRYALRERWLQAFDIAGAREDAPLPPLSHLVAWAARPTRVGARLRTWLENPAHTPAPPEIRRLLAS
jgi:nicotinamide-nucleotide adenylyltransferase